VEVAAKKPASLLEIEYRALTARRISEATCKTYGYGIAEDRSGRKVQVAEYRNGRDIVAQHTRTEDKKFAWRGDSKEIDLFGQHLWSQGGKKLVVTEGEIDCLTVAEIQDCKWPTVSVPNGAKSAKKAFERAIEFLESFDEVVIMFDQDEPGQKAAEECAAVLSPGKAKIARLPLKDANEVLLAGKANEIINAIWRAKEYRPDSIVFGEDLLEVLLSEENSESFPYPWQGLQDKTLGIRLRELTTIVAGTGVGKSSVCRELALHLMLQGLPVGYIALEESVRESAKGIISLYLNVPHWEWKDKLTEAEIREAHQAVFGNHQCVMYDHWGSTDSDNLLSKIRYMVKACGCKHIFLDHLSIVVSGMDLEGDERRQIDNTMTALRTLVEELDIHLFLVNHLRRGQASHEEGAQVALTDIRGSGAIAQMSNIVIGLERDQQDEENQDITTLRVLKNRY